MPLLLATGLVCAVCAPLHALDRVTLRNGFTYDCARQEHSDPAHLRLYAAEGDAANFVEVSAADVVAIEALPPAPAEPTRPNPGSGQVGADLHALLAHAGNAHNIDAELLASIVQSESGGRATAVSRAGARGLMQLMPGTARALGVTDAFRPEQNINGGTSYLDALLLRYKNNLALALAAYNAGPAAVDRFHGLPPFPETQAYVARVMREFKRRKALEASAAASLLLTRR